MGIDAAAKSPKRIRRNWAKTTKGAVTATIATSQPVTLDGLGQLALNVATLGALTATGSALDVKPNGITAAKMGVLTTKGDLMGFSTLHVRVGVGTDGQVLTADSASAAGLKWVTPTPVPAPPVTTKGDLFTYGVSPARLPAGTNGQQLFADSFAATGLRWDKFPSGVATLVGGTVNVNDTRVTYSTIILLTPQTQTGTPGAVGVSFRVAGIFFTILSTSPLDTSDVGYILFEP